MNGEYCRFCQIKHDGNCPHPARQTFIDLREERDRLNSQIEENRTVIDALKASDAGYARMMVSHDEIIADLVRQREELSIEVLHFREACASVGETDGHGWAETTKALIRHAEDFARQSYAMKLEVGRLQNELCTATDQIPPDMEGDSLSVALIKLKDARDSFKRQLVEANRRIDQDNEQNAHANDTTRRTLFNGIKDGVSDVDIFLKTQLEFWGYVSVRQLPTGVIVGALRQLDTGGLFVGLTLEQYDYRYSYATLREAQLASETWDGQGHPPGQWIKRKGVGADMLGPGAVGDLQ